MGGGPTGAFARLVRCDRRCSVRTPRHADLTGVTSDLRAACARRVCVRTGTRVLGAVIRGLIIFHFAGPPDSPFKN